MDKPEEYDVCLSYATEDRTYVDQVAKILQDHHVRVFYDRYEKENLWGKDLYQHLAHVYRDSARFCVVFVSAAYASKLWTMHELASAQERALRENSEYVLPARFDDTELPGLSSSILYIDLREETPEDFGASIIRKVKALPEDTSASTDSISKPAPRQVASQLDPRTAVYEQKAVHKIKWGSRRNLSVLIGAVVVMSVITAYIVNPLTPERSTGPQVYQVRVLVLSPAGRPVEDAKVWSARGGEPKEVPGGREFEIPAAKRPTDGQITFFATKGEEQGATTVTLGPEAFVSGTIRLNPPGAVELRGIVQDESGKLLEGVQVSLDGSGEATSTEANGEFRLPPQPLGADVLLRAKKDGYVDSSKRIKVNRELYYIQLMKEGA